VTSTRKTIVLIVETIFFMAMKTILMTTTMVSGTDMIFCVTEIIVSVAETMVFPTKMIFSAVATMIFIGEMIGSVTLTIVFGTDMIISGIETMFSEAEMIISVTETMVEDDTHQIDSSKVSATIDFDHGLRHRDDHFSRGNDHFNDRKDLLGS
jgi:hypothetical protein